MMKSIGRRVANAFAIAFSLAALGAADATSAREPIQREVIGAMAVFHQATCSRSQGIAVARCHAHIRTDSAGNVLAGKAATATKNTTPSGFAPADLRSAYAITSNGSSSTIIAIVDAYGYPNAAADLATYRAQYGLPACTVASGCFIQIAGNGSSKLPAFNSGWAQEQALDIEMASVMCPNCRIMLVEAPDAGYGSLSQAVNTAVARGAKVVSNSYGGSESGSQSFAAAYNHPGVAIVASAGDSGYGAEFPATAPGTIAVGGTVLTRASGTARGWTETVWSGTGSGCSAVYAKPAWQTDPLCTKRMAADIAAVASPSTGVAVYGPTGSGTASGWMVFGGTSVAAPLIAGIYGSTGAAPTAAKKIWAAGIAKTGLNRVTSGNNGSCGSTYFCNAAASVIGGYNGPTGWGTPSGTSAF